MTCCAADAVPMRIAIIDVPASAADSWVQVAGARSPTWAKIHDVDTPRLTAAAVRRATVRRATVRRAAVRRVGEPADPYE
jgi:uncharacterized membrane protein YcgQ (UPF0703/DUF1980 family)